MMATDYIYVDGIPVQLEGEKNLLQVIRKVGVKLPTFCYHTDLSVYGACRMCMVEDERGSLYTACSTPAKPGMQIKTNTARLRKYRKNILELILANHCSDCTSCANNKACKLQELAVRFNITEVRFPNSANERRIRNGSSCITFDSGKCILCGDCVRTCHEVQNVGAIDFAYRGSKMVISTAFGKPISESPCVGCGQCAIACPTGAIMAKDDIQKVWDALANPTVKTVVQVAPAVRVGLGNVEGIGDGENVIGKIFAALRRMGFDEVYDTSFAADVTTLEETQEFMERLKEEKNIPLFTSCCPGWIQYAEKKHPELLPNISSCRSPMEMFASIIKEERKEEGKQLFHVAVMPCTAKKFEAQREEFKNYGVQNVDAVITTEEFSRMLKEAGLLLKDLDPEGPDAPYDISSGAGVIFGVTGGVTESVLRNVVADKSRTALLQIANVGERGNDGIKEFNIAYGENTLHFAVVSGLANAEKIIQRIQSGEHFDLVEVMACPGGCVNGGGQPFSHADVRRARGKGLYDADRVLSVRNAELNPVVEACYSRLLNGREHKLLHVEYGKH
ncbi:MAG: [FeFe] hydrogenase, group A [Spirochaetales bacterium]|nr:[FeFe] hydrogenase, group A [Candidatus Physcosoma equi]